MEIGGFMGNTGLRFDGKNLGNSVQNQTPPGGSLTSQEIMLPIPYCDGNYIVKLMPECLSYGGANQVAWISNKQRDRFTINYTYAGGWALDWMAIHLP
jgi:hypothetical protein